MSDPKKPRNAANAMFGLDDTPAQPNEERKPAAETRRPAGEQDASQATGFGFPQAPTVSFGRTANAAEPPRPRPADSAPPRDPAPYEARGAQQPGARESAPPQYVYVPAQQGSSAPGWMKWLLIIVLIIAAAGLILGIVQGVKLNKLLGRQADEISSLTRRADSSDQRFAELSAKFQVTAERLGLTQQELQRARRLAAATERQQTQAVQRLNTAIAQKASSQDLNQLQSASTQKFGQISGSLAGTQKDLDATKEALTGAKGELSGAIARTHQELVDLAHRTDRDYFEFHANKGRRQKVGSVQVQLVKTNTKHNLFTVNLFYDDSVHQRKDQATDQPVFFLMQGAPSALELVVNKLNKNTISGYISAPKGFITNASSVLSSRPNS
ncbi:MAG: hypothetical protein ACRD3D_07815 [Terriglobia bacterium]